MQCEKEMTIQNLSTNILSIEDGKIILGRVRKPEEIEAYVVCWFDHDNILCNAKDITCVSDRDDDIAHYYYPPWSFSQKERSTSDYTIHSYIALDNLYPGVREMLDIGDEELDGWSKVRFGRSHFIIGHIFSGAKNRLYLSGDECCALCKSSHIQVSLRYWREQVKRRWPGMFRWLITTIEYDKRSKVSLEDLRQKWGMTEKSLKDFRLELDSLLRDSNIHHSFIREGKKESNYMLVRARLTDL